MYKNKTVFILGAGASWHYGYPTGDDLVKMVIQKSKELANFAGLYRDGRLQTRAVLAGFFPDYVYARNGLSTDGDLSHHREVWNKFYIEAENLANRLAAVNPLLIDYFLDWNTSLQDIGKLMIAWVILECENNHRVNKGNINRKLIHANSPDLAIRRSADNIDVTKFKDDWYRYVLYRLASECRSPDDLLQNDVTFVTFNYDVSLENHLYKGLSSIDLFAQENYIERFLGENRVLHVYGKVRQNPFEDNEYGTLGRGQCHSLGTAEIIGAEIIGHLTPEGVASLTYRDYPEIYNLYYKAAFEQAYLASKSIQTIGSTKDHNASTIEAAKEAISNADCVYTLGYGFDEQNSQRLSLSEAFSLKTNQDTTPPVCFTNFENNNLVNKRASRLFFGHDAEFSSGRSNVMGNLISGRVYFEKSTRSVYDAFERDFDSIEEQFTYRTRPRT